MWQTFAFSFGQLKCPLCYHGIVFDVFSTLESENAQPVAQTQNSELFTVLKIVRRFLKPCLPPVSIAGDVRCGDHASAINLPGAGLPAQDTQHIISMSLFASGVARLFKLRPGVRLAPGCCLFRVQLQLCCPADYGRYRAENRWSDVPTMMAALFGTLMLASCTRW